MVKKINNLITKIEVEKGIIFLFMLWKNLPNDAKRAAKGFALVTLVCWFVLALTW